MNIIRLGDRIESLERPMPLGRSYSTAEHLAQRVFNPLPDQKDISSYYIQSLPKAETPPFADDLPDGTAGLGEYEVKIIGKLLKPQRPVLVIVGPMGSGKSTLKNYTALHLVKNRRHCEICVPPGERLIAHIDFNEHTKLNALEEKELNNQLYTILRDELMSRLTLSHIISETEELDAFWKQEINLFREQKSSSMAFRHLLSHSENLEDVLDFSKKNDHLLRQRKKMLSKIRNNPELHLDYLIRLWKYIITFHYCGSMGCGFVVFDNLDRVNPFVQRKVVEVTHTHARIGGPTFMILVRPETFDNVGLGTGIIDVEDHNGPKPFYAIRKNLNDFCKNPEKHYEPEAGLTRKQFTVLTSYFGKIRDILRQDSHKVFESFIDNSCGKSLRIGYLVAQGLFYASRAEMKNNQANVHDLVRLCIRGDSPQLRWKSNDVIEHLFHVSTHTSEGLLIKPRILRYLGRSQRERRKFGEVHNVLVGFGYDNEIITSAINDLMNINHQLVRSNGFDYYNEKSLRISTGDNLRITDIGKGYSDYLLGDLDYLQEVMLDTYVDGDHFPKSFSLNYVVDKFKLVYQFVDELRKIDRRETSQFTDQWGIVGYQDAFGDHMVSLDIIHGIYPSVIRILHALGPTHDRTELLTDFESLALTVEYDNSRVLGVDVESIVAK